MVAGRAAPAGQAVAQPLGGLAALLLPAVADAVVGLVAGALALAVVSLLQKLRGARAPAAT